MALLRIEPRELIAPIDGHRTRQAEHVLFHPTRGSLISITSSLLQEIDLATGALVGEIDFDLSPITSSTLVAGNSSDKAHVLDHLVAIGSYYVVGVFQPRYLIVWDLQDHVLQSISEVEKMQKSMVAVAGSLCKDHWLFYASEGSASIKVTSVDSKEIPKKISRKASNRSCQVVSLAYSTLKRTLCCGSSDGSVQFWSFSEDNALGGKEETAMATLLFTTPATQSPAIQLSFATMGSNASYLVAGYQSRAIEVWSLLSSNNSNARQRDPQRVAATQLSPQQAVDFAKKSGELSFHLHPQLPLLIAHWHSFHSSSSVIAWEFRPSIGGGSGAGSGGVLSGWSELISAGSRVAHGGKVDEDNSCAAGVCWFQGSLVCYKSTHIRSLSILAIQAPDATSSFPKSLEAPMLSSKVSLSLDQYWNYQEIPSNLVQITTNPEPSSGSSEFTLQHFSLQTGACEKLDDLPVWKNYQGKSLVPWEMVPNQSQSAVCVKLKDPMKAHSSSLPSSTVNTSVDAAEDSSFSYVVMEIKQKAGAGSARRGDDTNGGGESSSSSFRVSCGSQLDALDFCFADFRPDEAKQTQPWVLVVLASTGKSLCLQVKCDQVESSRILLQREVLRMFSTPIPLSSQSLHVSTVGSRLMYVSVGSDFRQVLQLSEDDLNVPSAVAGATGSWKADANEVVIDVTWNKSVAAASADSADWELLAAVRTTKRLVILNKSLSQIRAYDLARNLLEPQSVLWMVQTLFFVTKDSQLRYLTPLRMDLESPQSKSPHSRLVCCLGEPVDRSSMQHLDLLSICGDRLSYSVTDLRTLEVKAFLRPISISEPLLAGFVTPNGKLKTILERDVLVFAMSGGTESACPLTDYLLHILYYEFGWRETTLRLLGALNQPGGTGGGSGAAAAASAMGGSSSSSYPKSSHLSVQLLASLYLHSHKWKEFLKVFLAMDPGLEEYALADEDSGGAASNAKLPSRTGQIAQRFRKFGKIMDAIGQSELAFKCFDLAGDDLSILEMTKKTGGPPATSSMLTLLQRDWAKMNPPLSSIVNAEAGANGTSAQQLESVIWRRHDLFSLLCCDVLQQNERRSRLLSSVKPFDKTTLQVSSTKKEEDGLLDKSIGPHASILHWKRLVPEDAKDWIGVSSTPHFSSEDPKNPTYGLSSSSNSLLLSGTANGMATSSGGANEALDGASSALSSSKDAAASAKMTIGPFVDEEDAVVAYWRFEEGANLADGNSSGGDSEKTGTAGVESLDTSKRENNLQLLGFGSATKLVSSSAPIDKGEEGRIQEEFALRFPASSDSNDGDQEREAKSGDWGAWCIIRNGSTLDIGFVFDEDPYRRKLTFEAWLRNFVLAQKQQQQQAQQDDDDFGSSSSPATRSSQFADPGTRMIVCRKSKDDNSGSGDLWWGFSLVDGYLVLEFAGQSIKSDEKVSNAASWHHVAFSIDILSHKQASVKLFLQGRCVGTKEISSVDTNTQLHNNLVSAAASLSTDRGVLSYLHLGWQLKEYEMTEVRVWAAARTQDQLSDMKENYLGIAEAKKRMKIAIHQRNCQCEKCHNRRTKAPVAKLTMATPFPTTPPSATVRDRRRPQPKQ